MATSNAYSGALSLNTIHMEVGEGSTGTTCSIGDADIRNRMGYGSIATSFYGFYKSWGTSITHGTASAASSKLVSAQTSYGFSKNTIIFSVGPHGSVSDESITSNAAGNATIWLNTFQHQHFTDFGTKFNKVTLHSGTANTHTGLIGALATTDPFRASKINRVCWNDAARTILTNPAPTTNTCSWDTITLPASGTYDIGIRWANGA
jgi:hypothetical protein